MHWVGIEGAVWYMLVLEGEADDQDSDIGMPEDVCLHVGYDKSNSKDVGWYLLEIEYWQ